ncbi:MAG: TetR family transcriptional regulator C-terminal domain-containing protein, partial [Acidimicrobiales bacterium]
SEAARQLLTGGFETWELYLVNGLQGMLDRGELVPGAVPHDLATAIMTALEGGLLLSQTTRTTRPLELALDMALDHVGRYLC